MAMPWWAGAAGGLLGGLFGQKDNTPGYLKKNYNLFNQALKDALNLYDSTDLEASDKQAISSWSPSVVNQAMDILKTYDANSAAQGSPIYKDDTQKDLGRARIAEDASQKIADKQFQLDTTRAMRKASLLPHAGDAAAGFSGAHMLDQQYQTPDIFDSLMQLAMKVPWGKRGGGGGSDAFTDFSLPGSTQNRDGSYGYPGQ